MDLNLAYLASEAAGRDLHRIACPDRRAVQCARNHQAEPRLVEGPIDRKPEARLRRALQG